MISNQTFSLISCINLSILIYHIHTMTNPNWYETRVNKTNVDVDLIFPHTMTPKFQQKVSTLSPFQFLNFETSCVHVTWDGNTNRFGDWNGPINHVKMRAHSADCKCIHTRFVDTVASPLQSSKHPFWFSSILKIPIKSHHINRGVRLRNS